MRPIISHTARYGQDNRLDKQSVTSYFVRKNPINHNGRTLILDENAKFDTTRSLLTPRCLLGDGSSTINLSAGITGTLTLKGWMKYGPIKLNTTSDLWSPWLTSRATITDNGDGFTVTRINGGNAEEMYARVINSDLGWLSKMNNSPVYISYEAKSNNNLWVTLNVNGANSAPQQLNSNWSLITHKITALSSGNGAVIVIDNDGNIYNTGTSVDVRNVKIWWENDGTENLEWVYVDDVYVDSNNVFTLFNNTYIKGIERYNDGVLLDTAACEDGTGLILYTDAGNELPITTGEINLVRVTQEDAPLIPVSGDMVGWGYIKRSITPSLFHTNLSLYPNYSSTWSQYYVLKQIINTDIDNYIFPVWYVGGSPYVSTELGLTAGNYGTYWLMLSTSTSGTRDKQFEIIRDGDAGAYITDAGRYNFTVQVDGNGGTQLLFRAYDATLYQRVGAYIDAIGDPYGDLVYLGSFTNAVHAFIDSVNNWYNNASQAVKDGLDEILSDYVPNATYTAFYNVTSAVINPSITRIVECMGLGHGFTHTSNTISTYTDSNLKCNIIGRFGGNNLYWINNQAVLKGVQYCYLQIVWRGSGESWAKIYEGSIDGLTVLPKNKNTNTDINGEALIFTGRKDFPATPINNACLTLNGVNEYCTINSGLTFEESSTYVISALITNYTGIGQSTIMGSSSNSGMTIGFSGDTHFALELGNGATNTYNTGLSFSATTPFVYECIISTPIGLTDNCDSVIMSIKDLYGNTLSSWATSISSGVTWASLDTLFAGVGGSVNTLGASIAWLKIEKDDVLINYYPFIMGGNTVVYDVVSGDQANIVVGDLDVATGVQDYYSYKLEHGFTRYPLGLDFIDIPHSYLGNRNFFTYFNRIVPVQYNIGQEYPAGVLYVDERKVFSPVISQSTTLWADNLDQGPIYNGYFFIPIFNNQHIVRNGQWERLEDVGLTTPFGTTGAQYISDTGLTIGNSAQSIRLSVTQTGEMLSGATYPIVMLLLNVGGNQPIVNLPNNNSKLARISFDAYLVSSATTMNVFYFDYFDQNNHTQLTNSPQTYSRIFNYQNLDEYAFDNVLELFITEGGTIGDTASIIIDNIVLESVETVFDIEAKDIRFTSDLANIPAIEREWSVGKPLNSPRTFGRQLSAYFYDNIHFNLFDSAVNNGCYLFSAGDYLQMTGSTIEYDSIDMSVYIRATGSTGTFDILDNHGSDINERVRLRLHADNTNSGMTINISSGGGLTTIYSGVDLRSELKDWSLLRFVYNRNSNVSLYFNNRLVVNESLTGYTTVITSASTIGSSGNTAVVHMKDLSFVGGPRYLMEEHSGTTAYDFVQGKHCSINTGDIGVFHSSQSSIIDYGETYGFTTNNGYRSPSLGDKVRTIEGLVPVLSDEILRAKRLRNTTYKS